MGISSALSVGSVAPGVCTSTTRPANPFEGQMIYETNTDMVAIWNGSAWKYVSSAAAASGSVLQVKSQDTTSTAVNTTSTYAATGLSLFITPQSTSSKILVSTSHFISKNDVNLGNAVKIRIYRDAVVLQERQSLLYTGTATVFIGSTHFMYLDSPNTTSPIEYGAQFANSFISSPQVNHLWPSSIVLMEIAG